MRGSLAVAAAALALAGCGGGGTIETDRTRQDFRAGFVDGCAKRNPRPFCECLMERLIERGVASSDAFEKFRRGEDYERARRDDSAACESKLRG